MPCYLNKETESIQYKDEEWLIELDYSKEEIEALELNEVRDIIKKEIEQITDYHCFAE